jgi:hypothetical protein
MPIAEQICPACNSRTEPPLDNAAQDGARWGAEARS